MTLQQRISFTILVPAQSWWTDKKVGEMFKANIAKIWPDQFETFTDGRRHHET